MSDLVERLEHYAKLAMPHYPNDLCSEAKREIQKLRAALTQFVAACETAPPTSLMTEIGMACKVAKRALALPSDQRGVRMTDQFMEDYKRDTIAGLAAQAFEKRERLRMLEMMNTPTDYEERKKAFVELALARDEANKADEILRSVSFSSNK